MSTSTFSIPVNDAPDSRVENNGSPADSVARGNIQPHIDGINALQAQAALLVTSIQEEAQSAGQARAEINETLIGINESVANLQQQLESAKLVIAEFTMLHGNAQTNSNQMVEFKAQAAAGLQSLQTFLSSATENSNRVEAIKASAEQTQSVIATKSEHIEGGRTHVDKVRGEVDRLFTEAQQSAVNAEAQHQASRTSLENLSTVYSSAQTVKANTDSNAESVAKLLQQCEEHASTSKKLADISDTTEKNVKAYEARLAELELTAANRLKTIESLLPRATSAGLASAFNERRLDFKWPQIIWQSVFGTCVLALLIIAVVEFGFFSKSESGLTWDSLGLSLLHRLPYALPLVWLAIHASGKAAMAQRVEEDYAFKETVSRSFEGFRREMAELEGKAAPESALSRLCAGVLTIITNPPGRIYEKHAMNEAPLRALVDSAGPIANAASK